MTKYLLATLCVVVALSASARVTSMRAPMLAPNLHGYAAASSCQGCHQKEWGQWQDSHHAWAMREATPQNVRGDFNDVTFNDAAAGVRARFFRRDGQYYVNTEGAEGKRADFRILYTFGVYPLQQYLVAFPGGRLQSLTIAWDNRPKPEGGQRWYSLYPGQQFAVGDPLRWTGYSHNWNGMCADCHSTDLQKNYNDQTASFATTWKEINVGCQSCHGAGQAHVEWASGQVKEGKRDKTYPSAKQMKLDINFVDMSSHLIVDQCARCHSRRQSLGVGAQTGKPLLDAMLPATLQPGLYFPDGQKQGEVYVYGSFTQSKMYKHGVTCLDCHDPHTAQVKVRGNALCVQCHNPLPPKRFPGLWAKNYDTAEHTHHQPATPGSQCINCHMPARTYMGVDLRRDHFFRIPRPDLDTSTASPDVCTGCHKDKNPSWAVDAIQRWFTHAEHPPGYGATLLAARQESPDAFNKLTELVLNRSMPAIARATAAEELGNLGAPAPPSLAHALQDPDAVVRAYSIPPFSAEPASQRIEHLLPLLDDPTQAVRDAAVSAMAGVPLSELPKRRRPVFQAQLKDYEHRLRGNGDSPGNRLNLAVLLQKEGHQQEALEQYRSALRIDPYFSPARVNLVLLDNQIGRVSEAEKLLGGGIALKGLPAADRGHLAYMLALLLVQQGDKDQALQWMDQAAKALPKQPKIRYNQGLLMLQMGRRASAQKILEAGLASSKDNPDLLYALIYLHASAGETDEAREYLKRLEEAAPDDPRLPQLTQELQVRFHRP